MRYDTASCAACRWTSLIINSDLLYKIIFVIIYPQGVYNM